MTGIENAKIRRIIDMNAFTAIETHVASLGIAERSLVRMMRFWVAQRRRGEHFLPEFVAFAEACRLDGHAAVAIDSMLSLTESCLARALMAGDDDGQRVGFDEHAVLALVDQGRFVGGARTPRNIPHGLPGVLAWATVAVRRAFSQAGLDLIDADRRIMACPFGAATAG
ncbi:hypothetical protein GCM10011529_06610 [Polymorphobacter glacialis]|uniref:Uncharacterized protein n=1 Tax=Sandarakinorhabdus glacialis TaxID=1614636 RepID=A0A916ZLZ5_9SPHN|nr:hypothetical protein [Polymorphobacter glacialis]GGE02847.1 hypothetical protein GCM10011529_06610 [Polymorphobacter glacialis]